MKKIALLITLIAISSHGFSQTKKIAHRSHSGKDRTLILTTEDNFGGPATPVKKDTVVVKKIVTPKTVKTVKKVVHKKRKVKTVKTVTQ
jgi:hypothetical protein